MGDETVSLYWQSTGISQRFMKDLLAYCFSNPVIQKVVLFGSRARGDYRKTSDIDLAIYTNNATHSKAKFDRISNSRNANSFENRYIVYGSSVQGKADS
ncbi:nucleotidyltransferase domain-containing protein [Bacillus smithii]|uniref:nucleotidyltransferase domain-containing protein n=2 Tax=Bacillus smithii TaxID=1479 RepID=UPI003D216799